MAKSFSNKRDVYLEIADRYEKYIKLGVIRLGEKLPSVREAACQLGVNPNTVQHAYSLLEERGLIRSVPKKGAFVILGEGGESRGNALRELADAMVKFKDSGVSREEALSILEEVYKE